MNNLDKVNKALKCLGKRIKIEKFRGTAEHTNNIEFYQLTSGRMLVVFWDFGVIKSILEQVNKFNRYTYGLNGQAGTNTREIYFADYDYENNCYYDITA
jgi:hypothetical protein